MERGLAADTWRSGAPPENVSSTLRKHVSPTPGKSIDSRRKLEKKLRSSELSDRVSDRAPRLSINLPDDIISRIFVLVVLQDGDPAILNLALTCQKFHSIVCQPLFLEEAHFSWLDSVVEWKSLPPQHRDKYRRPYTISQCRYLLCGGLYKDCGAGYKGNGQRGVLQGFYSTEDYPGYCSWDCFINDGGLD
ncbi:hypothetical protein ACEWY4_001252 [Coilia grayii]|uniref:F-box domain-containing protein n=1 Tax=Coilia grayii TaxID=363190 RepID=A0ABD1KZ11_9TELE